jgi:hypothetical protein
MDNRNPNFSFGVNLSQIATASGGGLGNLPSGHYKVKVNDVYEQAASTGRMQVVFKVEIADGKWAGIPRTLRINSPTSLDDKVLSFWKAALESVGYTSAQIDGQGNINLNAALFLNKVGHISYKAGDKDAGVWDEANFITPTDYAAGIAADKIAAQVANAPSGSAMGSGQQQIRQQGQPPQGGGLGGFVQGGLDASVRQPQGGGLGGFPAVPPQQVQQNGGGLGGGVTMGLGGGLGGAITADSLVKSLGG